MAEINKQTVKNLAALSRIGCTEEEEEALLKDLQNILHYFEQLNEIDTENAPPCNQVLAELKNVMREDVVGDVMPRELFLANVAPSSKTAGLIKTPPILKQS